MELKTGAALICVAAVALSALFIGPPADGRELSDPAAGKGLSQRTDDAGISPLPGEEIGAPLLQGAVDHKGLFSSAGEKEPQYSFSDGLSIVLRLFFATVLGCVVALHPARLRSGKLTKKKLDTIKAQVLICIAGAMLVVLIEGAIERAFGLLGLGSFIRFRTSVKDPRETAVMFLLIGLGMAAGLEMYWVGVFGALFLFLILFPLEWTLGRSEALLKITIDTPSPQAAPSALQPLFEMHGLKVVKSKVNMAKKKVTFQLLKKVELDMAAFQAAILSVGGLGIDAVTVNEMAGEEIGADD